MRPFCSPYQRCSSDVPFKSGVFCGAWLAQWVKRTTLAQVMVSPFVVLSPGSASVLMALNLEPVSDTVCVCVCVCVSAPPPLILCLCLSLKNE